MTKWMIGLEDFLKRFYSKIQTMTVTYDITGVDSDGEDDFFFFFFLKLMSLKVDTILTQIQNLKWARLKEVNLMKKMLLKESIHAKESNKERTGLFNPEQPRLFSPSNSSNSEKPANRLFVNSTCCYNWDNATATQKTELRILYYIPIL